MKIKNSIFLIITIVLVATSISTFYEIEISSQKITSEIVAKTETLSQSAMNEISKLMFERQADIRQLNAINNPIFLDSDIPLKTKVDILRTFEKSTKAFTSLSLYDENGIKIGNTRNVGIGDDDSDKSFFVSAMQGHEYIDDVPVFSNLFNLDVIHFSGPVTDENGIPKGVLMAEFPLSKVTSIINYNEELISNSHIDLMSNDGTVIFSKDNREESFSRSLSDYYLFKTIKNSELKTISTIDENQDILAVIVSQDDYLDYQSNDWYLFVHIPTEIALQEVNAFRTNSIIVTSITITLGFLIANLFSHTITRPIVSLQKTFSKVIAGNFGDKAEVKGSDEIQHLAIAANEMMDSLKKTVELEKELVRAEENIKKERFVAIGELSGNLAHDIRNPLSSIQNSADIMKMETENPTEQFERSYSQLKKASSRINHQVNDIMDFLRHTPLQLEKKSLQHIFKSVLSNLEIPPNVTVNISSEDIEIECDRIKLESVFTNIVLNGIQSIDKDDGTVDINLRKTKIFAIIDISNSGPPIPEESVPRLFEALYTTKFKGTGLGLASCKNMIDLHDGTITVTPDPVSFQIKIPLTHEKNI